MDVSEIIRHECAFVDGLISNTQVAGKVGAEGGNIDNTERLADDVIYDRYLILACNRWGRVVDSPDDVMWALGAMRFCISAIHNGCVGPSTLYWRRGKGQSNRLDNMKLCK
jgi:hypothetical protein